MPAVDIRPPTLPVLEKASVAVQHVGDSSLSDFGNGVIALIKFIGGIIVKVLDFILNATAGTSAGSLFTNTQTSVASVIDNASHSVSSVINGAGDMTIREIIQHAMALVVAITDILLKIANAAIYLVTGKDGAGWALRASSTVGEASSRLLAQASAAYDGATHASLREMTHAIGDYSQHVGTEFVTLIGNLNGAAVHGGVTSLDGVPLDADVLDGVATAVQTALSL